MNPEKLNTRRLLSLYQSRRKQRIACICNCGCYEPKEDFEETYKKLWAECKELKSILDSREHIE